MARTVSAGLPQENEHLIGSVVHPSPVLPGLHPPRGGLRLPGGAARGAQGPVGGGDGGVSGHRGDTLQPRLRLQSGPVGLCIVDIPCTVKTLELILVDYRDRI